MMLSKKVDIAIEQLKMYEPETEPYYSSGDSRIG